MGVRISWLMFARNSPFAHSPLRGAFRLGQRLLRTLLLGHVADDFRKAVWLTELVHQRGCDHAGPKPRAVFAYARTFLGNCQPPGVSLAGQTWAAVALNGTLTIGIIMLT